MDTPHQMSDNPPSFISFPYRAKTHTLQLIWMTTCRVSCGVNSACVLEACPAKVRDPVAHLLHEFRTGMPC